MSLGAGLLRSFWRAAAASFILTICLLGAIGWLAAATLAGPKPVRFANPYFEFRLPTDWQCREEVTEQVCRNSRSIELGKQAAIILTMKLRGPQDNFDEYLRHLSTPRGLRLRADGGLASDDESAVEVRPSQIIRVGRRTIGAHEWVEGLHLGSEVANYYTHYYASLLSHTAVLITFSSHQSTYRTHQPEIDAMVRSLVVFQSAARELQPR